MKRTEKQFLASGEGFGMSKTHLKAVPPAPRKTINLRTHTGTGKGSIPQKKGLDTNVCISALNVSLKRLVSL